MNFFLVSSRRVYTFLSALFFWIETSNMVPETTSIFEAKVDVSVAFVPRTFVRCLDKTVLYNGILHSGQYTEWCSLLGTVKKGPIFLQSLFFYSRNAYDVPMSLKLRLYCTQELLRTMDIYGSNEYYGSFLLKSRLVELTVRPNCDGR